MNKPQLDLRQKLGGWARLRGKARLFRPAKKKVSSLPASLYEIQPGFVLGARLARARHKVSRLAVRELDPAALEAVSCLSNVAKPEELRETLQGIEAVLGNGKGPLGLLVPDSLVRVSILEFETLPGDAKDQQSLITWKMKPLLPFASDEARLSFEVTHQEPGCLEVVVMAARNSVLAEYESILEDLGGETKLMLPATAALLPLLEENGGGGELLLHVWPGGLTAVVVAEGRIRLWRSQPVRWTLPQECLAAVSQETSRILAGAQDHLKVEIGRVSLCVRPPVPEKWIGELGRAVGRNVQPLLPAESVSSGLGAEPMEVLRYFGAPLAGLLSNAS